MPLLSIAGKTAVVTGATGAIGFAIASRFVQEGARVVLAGRDQAKLDRCVRQMQEALAPTQSAVNPYQAHCFGVGDVHGWSSLVQAHDKIDILVNCAGESQQALLLRTSEKAVESLLDANLRSVILGCKAVGKEMARRRSGGCIINVSSLLAHRPTVGTSVYAAAKAGQLAFTTSLAQEFAPYGIRVNAIMPGYIASKMTEDLKDAEKIRERIPAKRFGSPEEVADAAAFLAKNGYANNCILNLDGGLSAV